MAHLWLSVAAILLSDSHIDLKTGFYGSIFLFFIVLCKVMFSIQVNDLCDQKEDTTAGKKRWIFYVPKSLGIAITMAWAAAGFAIIILTRGSVPVILSYATTILFGLFYSLPPVRFKERGIWGLIVYALAATIIYVLVPWAWFESSLVLLIFLLFTVFTDKWVQLHFHQVVDYQADLKNETQTYAVKKGPEQTRKTLRIASSSASFSMVGLLGYIIFFTQQEALLKMILGASVISVVAASGIYIRMAKKKSKHVSELIRELPWTYLGLTYLVFSVLPPVGFVCLAMKESLMWIIAALSSLSLLGISLHSLKYKYS
ncbi:MAG: UbiA family prenyltransferase [Candidatus Aminicenantes bacterium]|nr:UbiA family prenyltransferase [Candidatus Aminicenantes bacterium]